MLNEVCVFLLKRVCRDMEQEKGAYSRDDVVCVESDMLNSGASVIIDIFLRMKRKTQIVRLFLDFGLLIRKCTGPARSNLKTLH